MFILTEMQSSILIDRIKAAGFSVPDDFDNMALSKLVAIILDAAISQQIEANLRNIPIKKTNGDCPDVDAD